MTRRVGWLDCRMGASGDMLLAALLAIDVDVNTAVSALGVGLSVTGESVRRAGLAATRAAINAPQDPQPARRLADIRAVLDKARLAAPVRAQAVAVFELLARAEAEVHGIGVEEVHFHEVGALDALADVVGVTAGLAALELAALHASPPALGGGTVGTTHGLLPVPAPATLAVLRLAGIAASGGPVDGELLTPTGAALLATCVTAWTQLPAMTIDAVGVGAGSRDVADRPNVVRLVVGEALPAAPIVLECTVDDLDPRIWPGVLTALLDVGASDAWLTPVLMKKGRPGHVLAALAEPDRAGPVRAVMLHHTSTLGVRETQLAAKTALARHEEVIDVAGCAVRVKLGVTADGRVVNAMPEWEDVAAAAAALGRPAKAVLQEAQGQAAHWLWQ
ncbi:MAG: nickel pincer cofactor biosynthesis protein LarC [Mycobacteriales bacterium]